MLVFMSPMWWETDDRSRNEPSSRHDALAALDRRPPGRRPLPAKARGAADNMGDRQGCNPSFGGQRDCGQSEASEREGAQLLAPQLEMPVLRAPTVGRRRHC